MKQENENKKLTAIDLMLMNRHARRFYAKKVGAKIPSITQERIDEIKKNIKPIDTFVEKGTMPGVAEVVHTK